MRADVDADADAGAASPSSLTPTGASALHERHIGSTRTLAAKRYAGIVPGGVATRIGRERESARDRALNSRAEALRKALRNRTETATEGGDARATARLYEYASVLQEQAERCENRGDDGALREELTLRACEAYGRAAEMDGERHGVLYNWGIALGDRAERATTRGDGDAARKLWDEAIDKYERASRTTASGTVSTQQATQGLNNLGLAYQSRAACVDFERAAKSLEATQRAREERVRLLSAGVRKFRRALRLDPSFDRAAYNLGTAVYALSVEYASMARLYPQDASLAPLSKDYAVAAAIYVGLALANEPHNDVYATSHGIVKHFVPSPRVFDERVLFASDDAPPDDVLDVRLVLDAHSLRAYSDADPSVPVLDVPLAAIASFEPVEDASLASGVARALLGVVDPDVPQRLFACPNPRVRDRVIDAVVLARDLARRRREADVRAAFAS